MENRCVGYVCVKFSKMLVSSCEIIIIFFYWSIYFMVQEYGIVGENLLIVPTLGYVAVIPGATLCGSVFSTLGGSGSSTHLVTLPL